MRSCLGLTATEHYQNTWVEYDVDGYTFAITTTDIGHRPGAKAAVVGFEAVDLDESATRLKEHAMTFTDIFPTPACRMAVIEDPDSNHIVIHQQHEE